MDQKGRILNIPGKIADVADDREQDARGEQRE